MHALIPSESEAAARRILGTVKERFRVRCHILYSAEVELFPAQEDSTESMQKAPEGIPSFFLVRGRGKYLAAAVVDPASGTASLSALKFNPTNHIGLSYYVLRTNYTQYYTHTHLFFLCFEN